MAHWHLLIFLPLQILSELRFATVSVRLGLQSCRTGGHDLLPMPGLKPKRERHSLDCSPCARFKLRLSAGQSQFPIVCLALQNALVLVVPLQARQAMRRMHARCFAWKRCRSSAHAPICERNDCTFIKVVGASKRHFGHLDFCGRSVSIHMPLVFCLIDEFLLDRFAQI